MNSADGEPLYVTSGLLRLTRPQLIGTMAGMLLAALLAAIDQTIVGTAEPRIIASLSGFDRYPWVATIYLLTSTVSVPIFASLSDRVGRKPFFLSGVLLFVLASALCGAAGNLTFLPFDGMGQLIVFRGLQGIGAGIITGVLFTIVGDIFSPQERGKYQGLFAAVFGLASIFGPTLGGWLTDSWSWRACFYVNLPVGIIALLALHFEFPNMKPRPSDPANRLGRLRIADRHGGAAAARADLGAAAWLGIAARLAAAGVLRVDARGLHRERGARARSHHSAVAVPEFDHRGVLALFVRARHGHVRRADLPAVVHAGRARNIRDAIGEPADAAADRRGGGGDHRRPDGVATGEYKMLGIIGSILLAGGMVLFARMTG